MQRIDGYAEEVLPGLPSASFDLVVTSPPAFPSPRQGGQALGKEPSLHAYIHKLGKTLLSCRRLLRADGFLVLVIEPLPGSSPMVLLAMRLKALRFKVLGTYRWDHGDGTASWVIFLTMGQAHLNREHHAWTAPIWAIPRPPPDPGYGFYEWPDGLVEAIAGLTIPAGGRVLDPYAGKAQALAKLEPKYDVVAVDVLPC